MDVGSDQYLLSCDWGTSSFRLQLIDIPSGRPLAGVQANEGAAIVFDRWKNQKEVERAAFFMHVLGRHIGELARQVPFSLAGIPVVISGMASSSIGIMELPYAELPFSLDGAQARTYRMDPSRMFPHPVLLVSGVKSETDVMRGEETQLMGLRRQFRSNAVFLFPGTHSKHIHVQNGFITGFETYMTGEIFHLLTSHSILKDSVQRPRLDVEPGGEELAAFRKGVNHPWGGNLLHAAFQVRTNDLLGKLDKGLNFFFLSGLLIGNELRHLKEEGKAAQASEVVLCGGQSFTTFYRQAAEELGIRQQLLTVSDEAAGLAASSGHLSLLHLL